MANEPTRAPEPHERKTVAVQRAEFMEGFLIAGEHLSYIDTTNINHKHFKLAYDGTFLRVWYAKREVETLVPISNLKALILAK